MTTVSIQGHDPKAASRLHNVLSINMSLMGSGAAAKVMNATISYFPKGMRGPFYTSEETAKETKVDFDKLSFGGDGVAHGRFTARMCLRESMFADIDMNDCRVVKGKFETELRRAR